MFWACYVPRWLSSATFIELFEQTMLLKQIENPRHRLCLGPGTNFWSLSLDSPCKGYKKGQQSSTTYLGHLEAWKYI
jgi:hypothetical protein